MFRKYIKCAVALAVASAATAPVYADEMDDMLSRMFAGESMLQGEELDKALEQAAQHPFGSNQNPVRAEQPQGQRAYLSRLRCDDGKVPAFRRRGNVGPGPYGNIVDQYHVSCGDAEPKQAEIFIDMYHKGYIENEAVPGFSIDVIEPVGVES